MSDQQRPEGWQLPDHDKVERLDYFGVPYSAYERIKHGPDYGQLWKSFSEQFRSQPTRNIAGRNRSYSPNLEQIEIRETKQDDK